MLHESFTVAIFAADLTHSTLFYCAASTLAQRTLTSYFKRPAVPAAVAAAPPPQTEPQSNERSPYFPSSMPTAKRKEPPTPAAVAPTTIDEDELDRILASADLDAMERSATQASSSSQPPTQSAVPSPVKSPATRKRVISSPKGEAREAHRGGDEENDLSEDEGDFEASPSKPVTMKQQTLRPTALPEPTSIYSREERRQAKLRKFARENEARYAWLESPKDEAGRSPSDPNYDPSTLYIPAPAQRSFTPFEQQYWDIKKKHFDTVVFFRKGKVCVCVCVQGVVVAMKASIQIDD